MKKFLLLALIVTFILGCSPSLEGTTCDECFKGKKEPYSVVILSNGYSYCSDCLSDELYRCLNCGDYESVGMGYNKVIGLCDACSSLPYVSCCKCGHDFPENKTIPYKSLHICLACVEEMINS